MAYTFDGSEGKPIDAATAQKWMANYKTSLKEPNDTLAHFFGFSIIEQILGEPGCKGIRIYYGIDDAGKKQLLLIGADANGNNLWPDATAPAGGGGNIVADYSFPCPDYCPPK